MEPLIDPKILEMIRKSNPQVMAESIVSTQPLSSDLLKNLLDHMDKDSSYVFKAGNAKLE